MERFLYEKLAERSPHLSPPGLREEKAIIDYNVRRHGTKTLQRMLTGVLYRELKDYRIYSMSKRFDNLSLWAKYAGDHSGYCLEFANEGPLFANARNMLYGDSLQMDLNNDLGFLPESRKMPQIARDQVVRSGSISAFQEHIVVGVAGHFKAARRRHGVAMVLDELQ